MTWANRELLTDRLGDDKITKLATRRVWNETLSTYIDDSSDTVTDKSINQALENSKAWLMYQISCCFDYQSFKKMVDEGSIFPMILEHHLRLSVEFLRWGGDCEQCDPIKKEFKDMCGCGQIMDQNGDAIEKLSSFYVTNNKICLPESYCSTCCEDQCKCHK